jgi:hypothetical protein
MDQHRLDPPTCMDGTVRRSRRSDMGAVRLHLYHPYPARAARPPTCPRHVRRPRVAAGAPGMTRPGTSRSAQQKTLRMFAFTLSREPVVRTSQSSDTESLIQAYTLQTHQHPSPSCQRKLASRPLETRQLPKKVLGRSDHLDHVGSIKPGVWNSAAPPREAARLEPGGLLASEIYTLLLSDLSAPLPVLFPPDPKHRRPGAWGGSAGDRGGRRYLLGAFNSQRRLSARRGVGAIAPATTSSPDVTPHASGPRSRASCLSIKRRPGRSSQSFNTAYWTGAVLRGHGLTASASAPGSPGSAPAGRSCPTPRSRPRARRRRGSGGVRSGCPRRRALP